MGQKSTRHKLSPKTIASTVQEFNKIINDPSIQNFRYTNLELNFLQYAIYCMKNDFVLYIMYIFDIIDEQQYFGNTALHLASIINDSLMAEILIATVSVSGLDLNKPNKNGHLPFQLGIIYNNYNTAALLMPQQYQREHPSLIKEIRQKRKGIKSESEGSQWDSIENKIVDEELQQLRSRDWDAPLGLKSVQAKQKSLQEPFEMSKTMEINEIDHLVVNMLAKDGNYDRKSVVKKYEEFKKAVWNQQLLIHNLEDRKLDMTQEKINSDLASPRIRSPIRSNNQSVTNKTSNVNISLNDLNFEQTVNKILADNKYMGEAVPSKLMNNIQQV
ncbi:UNKNOWN [Stylonychia lemnae]|uniref:Uncharacterized protein n=1 Tax=Stylonychia lemnae TaxID=5949 RepID=A0A078ADC5_STYLE|nr:UNKNOWN [Stylonychia lemnae]|eukprot:CDW80240.1 UNKNOWN [Stylonychia lemnae]